MTDIKKLSSKTFKILLYLKELIQFKTEFGYEVNRDPVKRLDP